MGDLNTRLNDYQDSGNSKLRSDLLNELMNKFNLLSLQHFLNMKSSTHYINDNNSNNARKSTIIDYCIVSESIVRENCINNLFISTDNNTILSDHATMVVSINMNKLLQIKFCARKSYQSDLFYKRFQSDNDEDILTFQKEFDELLNKNDMKLETLKNITNPVIIEQYYNKIEEILLEINHKYLNSRKRHSEKKRIYWWNEDIAILNKAKIILNKTLKTNKIVNARSYVNYWANRFNILKKS